MPLVIRHLREARRRFPRDRARVTPPAAPASHRREEARHGCGL